MATTIICDTCRQAIPRGSGWQVRPVSNHPAECGDHPAECGDPTGEYCSTVCLAQAANRGRGQRPNFAAARLRLQSQVNSILDEVDS